MDQSSVHGHMRDGSLNANTMSVRFGDKKGKLRKTKTEDVGTYERVLNVGDFQLMNFEENDNGPFYLNPKEQTRRKYDRLTGRVGKNKAKKQLLEELKGKGFLMQQHYTKDEIHELAQNQCICLKKRS